MRGWKHFQAFLQLIPSHPRLQQVPISCTLHRYSLSSLQLSPHSQRDVPPAPNCKMILAGDKPRYQ